MWTLLAETVALVGATVHPMTPDGAPALATVLVEDGEIVAVGPDVEVPEGAEVLQLDGLHVVPGLVDAVVTFDPAHDPLYLAAGVTTVRDLGSPAGRMLLHSQPEARDLGPGPSLLLSGQVLAGPRTRRTDALVARSQEQAALILGRTFEALDETDESLDFLAIDSATPPALLDVVAGFAQKHDLEVWGPIPDDMTVESAASKGQTGLVGLDSLVRSEGGWSAVEDVASLRPTIDHLAEGGWSVAPLLASTARIVAPRDEEPAELAWLSPELEAAWRADLALFRAAREQSDAAARYQRSLGNQRAALRLLHEAGVPLVPGTAAPSPWILPGAGLHDELEQWVLAGIPTEDVLRLATAGAADAVGLGDTHGRIAPGRVADLVVVGSDPRESVAALRQPEMVVVRGRVLESFDLADALDALAAREADVRAELDRPVDVEPPPMPEGALVASGRAETRAAGLRLSTERWAVVRTHEDDLAYGVRVHIPGTSTEPGRELVLVQTVRDGLVRSFDLSLDLTGDARDPEAAGPAFSAEGRTIGDTRALTIERRRGGLFLGNQRAEEPIALVDMSTVLSGLVAAKEFPAGHSYVVSFEGPTMEPVVDRWEMRPNEENGRVEILTTRGWLAFGFEADGEPVLGFRSIGGSEVRLAAIAPDRIGGPGLALPAERVYREPDAGGDGDAEAASGDGDGGR